MDPEVIIMCSALGAFGLTLIVSGILLRRRRVEADRWAISLGLERMPGETDRSLIVRCAERRAISIPRSPTLYLVPNPDPLRFPRDRHR